MQYRRFGRTGWQVSEVGYGMWGMGGWKESDDEESIVSLQRAIDLGCNFFDTAWAYGNGHSEKLFDKIVRANPGSNCISLLRSHRRISDGPVNGSSAWKTAFHLIISKNISTKAWKIWVSAPSI